MKTKQIIFILIISISLIACKKQKTYPELKLDSRFEFSYFLWPRYTKEIDSSKMDITMPLFYQDGKFTGTTLTDSKKFAGSTGRFEFLVDRNTYSYISWKCTIFYSDGTTHNHNGVTEKVYVGGIGGYSIDF